MVSVKPAVLVGLIPPATATATARTHPSPAPGFVRFRRSGRMRAINHSPPFVVGAFFNDSSNSNGSGSNGNSRSVDTADRLRDQLDQLHAESEATRSKANSARLRLMRLTETAENLQTRAAKSVLVGKETEARELLIQKKKLMQALEKSRNRIELLDRLSTKIHEAISLKETQLIEQVSKNPEVNEDDFCQQIRFVSSEDNIHEVPNGETALPQYHDKPGDFEEFASRKYGVNLPLDSLKEDSLESASIEKTNDFLGKLESNLFSLSSYDGVLRHAYKQLELVETSLEKFLRSQFMITKSEKRYMHRDLQKMLEILKDVLILRERIQSMLETTEDDS